MLSVLVDVYGGEWKESADEKNCGVKDGQNHTFNCELEFSRLKFGFIINLNGLKKLKQKQLIKD